MSTTVLACPECNETSLSGRLYKEPKYLCKACRAEFDEPVERPPKSRKTPFTFAIEDGGDGG